jgi:hypothetical protein
MQGSGRKDSTMLIRIPLRSLLAIVWKYNVTHRVLIHTIFSSVKRSAMLAYSSRKYILEQVLFSAFVHALTA